MLKKLFPLLFILFLSPAFSSDLPREVKYSNEIKLAQQNNFPTSKKRKNKIFTTKNYLIFILTLTVIFLGIIAYNTRSKK
jgi:hypothetical protein